MEKYDIRNFLYEFEMGGSPQDQINQEEEPVPNPQQPQQQGLPQQAQPAPGQPGNQQQIPGLQGKTISNASFEALGENGGKLSITLSDNQNPLVISWVGQRVEAVGPDGNKVPLGGQ